MTKSNIQMMCKKAHVFTTMTGQFSIGYFRESGVNKCVRFVF